MALSGVRCRGGDGRRRAAEGSRFLFDEDGRREVQRLSADRDGQGPDEAVEGSLEGRAHGQIALLWRNIHGGASVLPFAGRRHSAGDIPCSPSARRPPLRRSFGPLLPTSVQTQMDRPGVWKRRRRYLHVRTERPSTTYAILTAASRLVVCPPLLASRKYWQLGEVVPRC